MTSHSTTILDLNDDCLRTIFRYLNSADLNIVVDVCGRFRSFARERFSSLPIKSFAFREVEDACELQKRWKFFRDFGPYVKEVYAAFSIDKWTSTYPARFADMLSRSCSENLTSLQLWELHISDEIAGKLRPVLQHLQNLGLKNCSMRRTFLRQLPRRSPELRELKLVNFEAPSSKFFVGLHQNYAQLEKIEFENVNVKSKDIARILKSNPQLKTLLLTRCQYLDDGVFPIVAKYVPQIELLELRTEHSVDPANLQHLSQMKNLKYFSLSTFGPCPVLSLAEIDFASTLENLSLYNCDVFGRADQFVDRIKKLPKLRHLMLLNVTGLTVPHILDICHNLPDLSNLFLSNNGFTLSVDNLIQILRVADKLARLFHSQYEDEMDEIVMDGRTFLIPSQAQKLRIDIATFKTMVDLIGKRRQKHLELNSNLYQIDVPDYLIKMHENCLKFEEEE